MMDPVFSWGECGTVGWTSAVQGRKFFAVPVHRPGLNETWTGPSRAPQDGVRRQSDCCLSGFQLSKRARCAPSPRLEERVRERRPHNFFCAFNVRALWGALSKCCRRDPAKRPPLPVPLLQRRRGREAPPRDFPSVRSEICSCSSQSAVAASLCKTHSKFKTPPADHLAARAFGSAFGFLCRL